MSKKKERELDLKHALMYALYACRDTAESGSTLKETVKPKRKKPKTKRHKIVEKYHRSWSMHRRGQTYECLECHQILHGFNNAKKHVVECHNYRICIVCKNPFKPIGNKKICPKHDKDSEVNPKFQRLMQQRIKAGQKFQI